MLSESFGGCQHSVIHSIHNFFAKLAQNVLSDTDSSLAGQFYPLVLIPFLEDTARLCEPQRRKRSPVPVFRSQLSKWGDKGRDGKSEKEELSRNQSRRRGLLDSLLPSIPASFLFPALLFVLVFSTQPLLILYSSQAWDLPKVRVSPGQLLYSLASTV